MIKARKKVRTTLEVAVDVASILEREGAPPVVIGAVALASHNYQRATHDLDFAIAVLPRRMRELRDVLAAKYDVKLTESDAQDSLGGLIEVKARGAMPIEIINFDNDPAGGFPRIVTDALKTATNMDPEVPLLVVSAVDLIIFKVYSGGTKSEADIAELLARNKVDLDELRARCRTYRLDRRLEAVLAKVRAAG